MANVFYLPLEVVPARYTEQLCDEWMADAFAQALTEHPSVRLIRVEPDGHFDGEIRHGCVLDAATRAVYSMRQCEKLVEFIDRGELTSEDVIYLQDFWTPGFEAVMYAASVVGVTPAVFAMCHAQTVDEYDFTHPFRYWMEGSERALDRWITYNGGAIFCASTVHKQAMQSAGWQSPVHVVGLPIDPAAVAARLTPTPCERKNRVVFSSRLDLEKNPWFMLAVAEKFIDHNSDWEFHVCTSARDLRSNVPNVVEEAWKLQARNRRFVIHEGLTKDQYYAQLCHAKVQFNCSTQDFVSWTLLEALICGCDVCYPNVRSFPEVFATGEQDVPLYPFPESVQGLREPATGDIEVESCIAATVGWLTSVAKTAQSGRFKSVLNICNTGRLLCGRLPVAHAAGYVGCDPLNLWHESRTLANLFGGQGRE